MATRAATQIPLVAASLKQNKAVAILMALQVAFTLCIISNSAFVIYHRFERMSRPTGIDEKDLILFRNEWVGSHVNLKAGLLDDLRVLRDLPDVVDAYATNSVPLSMAGGSLEVRLQITQGRPTAIGSPYVMDEHSLSTLGMHLSAGRWFVGDEVREFLGFKETPPVVIITRALGSKLFPNESALGKTIYVGKQSSVIIGIVDKLATPLLYGIPPGVMDSIFENSIMVPGLLTDSSHFYIVRAKPGHRESVLVASQKQLVVADRARSIDLVQTFDELRADAYKEDRSLASILPIVCVLLLTVTSLGVIGLASYWVSIRHTPIGIRRALGARRIDIIRFFQIENFLIVSGGAALGVMLAEVTSLYISQHFEMPRVAAVFVAVSATLSFVLGQVAVLWPALRAASVPPTVAIRSI